MIHCCVEEKLLAARVQHRLAKIPYSLEVSVEQDEERELVVLFVFSIITIIIEASAELDRDMGSSLPLLSSDIEKEGWEGEG